MLEGWQLGMLEDYGLADTNTGLINRVARKLAEEEAGSHIHPDETNSLEENSAELIIEKSN